MPFRGSEVHSAVLALLLAAGSWISTIRIRERSSKLMGGPRVPADDEHELGQPVLRGSRHTCAVGSYCKLSFALKVFWYVLVVYVASQNES